MNTTKPYKLHRFSTYQEPTPTNESVTRTRHIESAEGEPYTLHIHQDSKDFRLTLPSGANIKDNLETFQDREALYKPLEDGGIYSWLIEVADDLYTESIESPRDDWTEMGVRTKDGRYRLRCDPDTGFCELSYPARKVDFYIDDMYLKNPGLPLIAHGGVNDALRDQMMKNFLEPPETPYESGVKVSGKK